jgi:hypothetical protein
LRKKNEEKFGNTKYYYYICIVIREQPQPTARDKGDSKPRKGE